MSTEQVKLSCTQCESDSFKFWGKEYTGIQIVKCDKCQLRLVSPREEMETLEGEVYSHDNWEEENAKFRDLQKQKNAFTYDYLSLMKAMEFNKAEAPSILDIGAGRGGFLLMAKASGFDNVTGLDINPVNKPQLEKFDIPLIVGHVDSPELDTYDVINAQHVLEHVADPRSFLLRVKKLLKPNGVAHIVVPNEGGIVAKQKSFLSKLGVKKKPFKHLTPWHHFFFFDKKSFPFVLEDSGFEILYMGTRNNIKSKGLLYEFVHKIFDALKWNTHLEVVVRPVRK